MTRKITWCVWEALSVLCSRLKIIFHLKAHDSKEGILITKDILKVLGVHLYPFLRATFLLLFTLIFNSLNAHTLLPQYHQQPFISRRSWLTFKFIAFNFPTFSLFIALEKLFIKWENEKRDVCVCNNVCCSSFINKGWKISIFSLNFFKEKLFVPCNYLL